MTNNIIKRISELETAMRKPEPSFVVCRKSGDTWEAWTNQDQRTFDTPKEAAAFMDKWPAIPHIILERREACAI